MAKTFSANRPVKKSLTIGLVAALIAALVIIGVHISCSSEKQLAWKTFNDGLAEAKVTKKTVLVDVYTDWCGWCKRMDADTYSDETIATYIGQHYIPVKLNAESSRKLTYNTTSYTEQEFAAAFGISGYPSTIFLTSDGEPITVFPGYAEARKFKSVLSFIAEDHYLTKGFDEYSRSH
jgi:thioredoxin-related protein